MKYSLTSVKLESEVCLDRASERVATDLFTARTALADEDFSAAKRFIDKAIETAESELADLVSLSRKIRSIAIEGYEG